MAIADDFEYRPTQPLIKELQDLVVVVEEKTLAREEELANLCHILVKVNMRIVFVMVDSGSRHKFVKKWVFNRHKL